MGKIQKIKDYCEENNVVGGAGALGLIGLAVWLSIELGIIDSPREIYRQMRSLNRTGSEISAETRTNYGNNWYYTVEGTERCIYDSRRADGSRVQLIAENGKETLSEITEEPSSSGMPNEVMRSLEFELNDSDLNLTITNIKEDRARFLHQVNLDLGNSLKDENYRIVREEENIYRIISKRGGLEFNIRVRAERGGISSIDSFHYGSDRKGWIVGVHREDQPINDAFLGLLRTCRAGREIETYFE